MTVVELTARLQEFPPDAPVFRHDSEWGPQPVNSADHKEGFTTVNFLERDFPDYTTSGVVIR